jgi:hypothetical protein
VAKHSINLSHHIELQDARLLAMRYRHMEHIMGETLAASQKYEQVEVEVKVKLSLCFVLTEHHAMEAYWGNGGIAPRILDLGTRYR